MGGVHPSTVQGQAAQKSRPAPPAASVPVHYYSGDFRVETHLLLDEVELEMEDGPSRSVNQLEAALRAAAPDARVLRTDDRAGNLMAVGLSPATGTTAGLEARIRALRQVAGIRAVRPVLVRANRSGGTDGARASVTGQFTVGWKEGESPADLEGEFGFRIIERRGLSGRAAIAVPLSDDILADVNLANRLKESGRVEFATPLVARWRYPRLVPDDPQYGNQWHLNNTGSNAIGAVAGNDVNIEDAWTSVTGQGVNIAVTDDGVQTGHPDLTANARTDIDYDFNGNDTDPSPGAGNSHGTAVAGVAAARGNNSVGVSGAGPQAGIIGLRLIAAPTTDAQESSAMLHQAMATAPNTAHINTNSWGPTDNGTYEAMGPLTTLAISDMATSGRADLGTIYTWAAGNGLTANDNANYDGYANSRHTIAIAATGAAGQQAYYSEPGACILANTPSNYWTTGTGITTTDRTGGQGYSSGDYTASFGGTSSACPLAAGCIALVLQANPGLTWRDVQHLIVNTATVNSPLDSSWLTNGAGRKFSHKFGFGRIDATAAVEAALNWTTVTAAAPPLASAESVPVAIPDNNTSGISRSLNVSGAPDFEVEHVEVAVTLTHTYVGDLRVELVTPSGTVSVLAETRAGESASWLSNTWTYMTVANWGENPNGVWTLRVSDRAAVDVGTLVGWQVTVHGFAPSLVPVEMSMFIAE